MANDKGSIPQMVSAASAAICSLGTQRRGPVRDREQFGGQPGFSVQTGAHLMPSVFRREHLDIFKVN
eukprot:556304-Pleurochrysis_carterae.AAC.1